ncbi:MAG: putative DOCK family protein [Streblomastix strix]|uniref:Putative DOCK family protein n=1 Tax=Streblomastix strix TaxID=222440 RepID=A0A5J4WKP3_9EUKA|nr:MAG: putative DOCK family protein [Streblomastix strix]
MQPSSSTNQPSVSLSPTSPSPTTPSSSNLVSQPVIIDQNQQYQTTKMLVWNHTVACVHEILPVLPQILIDAFFSIVESMEDGSGSGISQILRQSSNQNQQQENIYIQTEDAEQTRGRDRRNVGSEGCLFYPLEWIQVHSAASTIVRRVVNILAPLMNQIENLERPIFNCFESQNEKNEGKKGIEMEEKDTQEINRLVNKLGQAIEEASVSSTSDFGLLIMDHPAITQYILNVRSEQDQNRCSAAKGLVLLWDGMRIEGKDKQNASASIVVNAIIKVAIYNFNKEQNNNKINDKNTVQEKQALQTSQPSLQTSQTLLQADHPYKLKSQYETLLIDEGATKTEAITFEQVNFLCKTKKDGTNQQQPIQPSIQHPPPNQLTPEPLTSSPSQFKPKFGQIIQQGNLPTTPFVPGKFTPGQGRFQKPTLVTNPAQTVVQTPLQGQLPSSFNQNQLVNKTAEINQPKKFPINHSLTATITPLNQQQPQQPTALQQSPSQSSIQSSVIVANTETQFKQKISLRKESIDNFLQIIWELADHIQHMRHYIVKLEHEDELTFSIQQLIEYLSKTGREDMKIQYMFLLYHVHMELKNVDEAGEALVNIAREYQFSPDDQPGSEQQSNPNEQNKGQDNIENQLQEGKQLPQIQYCFPPGQTSAERKASILYEAVQHFMSQTQQHERAVELLDEMIVHYRYNICQYQELAQCLVSQAKVFRGIIFKPRQKFPNYYIVNFIGQKFKLDYLHNKEYLFRQDAEIRLEQFMDLMKLKFPKANAVGNISSFKVPVGSDKNTEAAYVLIGSGVNPSSFSEYNSLKEFILQTSKQARESPQYKQNQGSQIGTQNVKEKQQNSTQLRKRFCINDPQYEREKRLLPAQVIEYAKHVNVDVFVYSRGEKRKQQGKENDNEQRQLWTVKTFIFTEDTFPSTSRRIPIKSQQSIEISPIQSAIIAIREKNEKLKKMMSDYSHPLPPADSGATTTLIYQRVKYRPANLSNFTMLLQGSIDAAVSGGLRVYVEAFIDTEYINRNRDEYMPQLELLVEEMKTQCDVLNDCLQLHRKLAQEKGGCSEEMMQRLDDKLEDLTSYITKNSDLSRLN